MNSTPWPLPPRPAKADGAMRRVGVEIELQGIEVAQLARLTAEVLGGALIQDSAAMFTIDVAGQGEWRVEVDLLLLKELAREAQSGDSFKALLADVVEATTSLVVPCEIVSPPLPMDTMGPVLDELVQALYKAGARGTRHTPWYAFGVHLNVDVPDASAATLLTYLQAFVCAYDWLVWHGKVDLARRITPYIDAFPRDYDLLITKPNYTADMTLLIDDYLAHSPTRNRALDMLPMFSQVDPARVQRAVDDPLVQARPALHYRLANSSVDEPDWSIRQPWVEWVALERLAADSDALRECCAAFRKHRKQWLHAMNADWRREAGRWLHV